MARGYKKKAIITLIFVAVLIAIGSFYLNFQIQLRKSYLELKNSEYTATATVTPITPVSAGEKTKYKYVFSYKGEQYASTTLLSYTAEQMKSGKITVKFVVKGSVVVLSSSEKSADGLPIAKSCEAAYFSNSQTPSLTAAIAIFSIAAMLALYAAICLICISRIKSILKYGTFTYAMFVEAYPSRFGSNRYMAVRYTYKNDLDEWVEAVSPYAYSPSAVETLKNLEAIGIKYKGKSSVIAESLCASFKPL